jgi:hypothetical protein
MSKPLSLASLLLVSTALYGAPAFAQDSGGAAGGSAAQSTPSVAAPGDAQTEEPADVSIPGGDIVVVGRARDNIVRSAPQVVSVLSSADIARTGEGDIAGALQRVTGLSVVGNGFVYVRGLGDRYSLALLNGSPLPSPEPLRRVVPLDLFPTDVIASSLVQKSYSANFPGEFGGGVINLTTRSTPDEPFLTVGASISGDTETTGRLGYTYFGSRSDWTGFDNGTRDVPGPLAAAFASGKPILEGADFSRADLGAIASSLVNSPTTVLQKNNDIPVNFSGDVSGGGSIDVGSVRLGLIATAGISNKWRTRETTQQLSLNADLSGDPQTDFDRVITDNRVVVNGLLGLSAEFGQNKIRWTNLYIRDTLKQSRLGLGTDQNRAGADILRQDTAWYERQLINTQIVGEFDLSPVHLDLRGSYANSQREAPYERSFTYIRTNQAADPVGGKFINDLGGSRQGEARIAFSDLNENLYSGGIDLRYDLSSDVKLGIGYAYSDTSRTSIRRELLYRAANLPIAVQQLRPDYLVSDSTIQNFGLTLLETTASDGTAAFDAGLKVHGGYGQLTAQILPSVNVVAGVRYEKGKQDVTAIDLFGTGLGSQFNTRLNNDYFLPAITATIDVAPQMQVRLNGSRTIARPQFRELIRQVYIDTDSNRTFQGNPSLVDSKLWNAEARWEYFFARDQRVTVSGFYKKLDNPIEAYSSILSSDITTSFANAPSANLYGVELEAQKYIPLTDMGGFFTNRRLLLIGNYTYTKSKIKVGADDNTIINGVTQASSNFFRDGSPLTGQSDHLVNGQIGFEDTTKLSQQTLLVSYASDRVTTRGPSGQPDVKERPGIRVDFVARQGVSLFGVESELKFEARNITATKYKEFQQSGDNRVYYNRYDVGAQFSLGLGVKF